ncbi:MAG: DUF2975 domain-containing protein [Clostridia bacterium]|nr:DUF2975 domain-containing protein [Clostridia bacterium]
MKQKSLSKWLKLIIIGVGVCGLVSDFVIIPAFGQSAAGSDPALTRMYLPWLIFAWVFSAPCFAALVLSWLIARNIGLDRSFSEDNAKYMKYISVLAGADTAFFFVMNIVFLFLGMNHPGVLIFSLIVDMIGVAISVAAAALSHLIAKAAELQDQSDLTI